jgi:hypothetical protein
MSPMVENITSNDANPRVDPLTARRIRAALGLPEPATPESTDPAVLASLHEANLDDFQRLLRTTNEDQFIAVARNIDPLSSDPQGLTIGHHAARLGYVKALAAYIDAYPKPRSTTDKSYVESFSIVDVNHRTSLEHAVEANNFGVINFIMSKAKGYTTEGNISIAKRS